jgi:hypothetical protein
MTNDSNTPSRSEAPPCERIDTYTPMMWAAMDDDARWVEYVRVLTVLTAAESALDEARKALFRQSEIARAQSVMASQAQEAYATAMAQLDEARKARDAGDGASLIAAERARQMSVEGWTPAHDDGHRHGEMAISAARYALEDVSVDYVTASARGALQSAWRWESCWWKPKDPIRNLVRAGALIAAEIDRRLRAERASLPSPVVPDTTCISCLDGTERNGRCSGGAGDCAFPESPVVPHAVRREDVDANGQLGAEPPPQPAASNEKD